MSIRNWLFDIEGLIKNIVNPVYFKKQNRIHSSFSFQHAGSLLLQIRVELLSHLGDLTVVGSKQQFRCHVLVNRNPHNLAGKYQLQRRDGDIFVGRLRIPGRVVGKYESRSLSPEGRMDDLSGVYAAGGQRSFRVVSVEMTTTRVWQENILNLTGFIPDGVIEIIK